MHGFISVAVFRRFVKGDSDSAENELLLLFRSAIFFLGTIALSEIHKKILEDLTAFLLQYPSMDNGLMVELRHFQEIQDGATAARLGIHTAHDYLRNPGLDDGSGAHLAWF